MGEIKMKKKKKSNQQKYTLSKKKTKVSKIHNNFKKLPFGNGHVFN